jgi:hypothetical protein
MEENETGTGHLASYLIERTRTRRNLRLVPRIIPMKILVY